jgi:urease accessory protein
MTPLTLLLLADGRFPVGGHAHSGGIEAAVMDGRVRDEDDLAAYVRGRLYTTARTEAALAAATVVRLASGGGPTDVAAIDAEADARIAATPLRTASRRLGRQLLRVAARCWPCPLFQDVWETATEGLHQPVALGVVGAAAGLPATAVATLAVHHALSTPAQAAIRLLGLDPFAVAAALVRLASAAEEVASEAARAATGPLWDLPAGSGPVCEIAAMEHGTLDARLFVT